MSRAKTAKARKARKARKVMARKARMNEARRQADIYLRTHALSPDLAQDQDTVPGIISSQESPVPPTEIATPHESKANNEDIALTDKTVVGQISKLIEENGGTVNRFMKMLPDYARDLTILTQAAKDVQQRERLKRKWKGFFEILFFDTIYLPKSDGAETPATELIQL